MGQNWPDATGIGPILAQLRHIYRELNKFQAMKKLYIHISPIDFCEILPCALTFADFRAKVDKLARMNC